MKKILLVIFMLYHTSLWAKPCTSDDYDKAEYYSEKAAAKIVEQYGGGQDVRMELRSCSYNKYSKTYKTIINVYWNGAVFSFNHYNVDGELKFKSDGTLISFAKSYENDAVKDLKYLVGGLIVFAAISSDGKH